jgi:hypothetical protein
MRAERMRGVQPMNGRSEQFRVLGIGDEHLDFDGIAVRYLDQHRVTSFEDILFQMV